MKKFLFAILLFAPAFLFAQNVGRLKNDSIFNGVQLGESFSKYMMQYEPVADFKNGGGYMSADNNINGVPVLTVVSVENYKVTGVTVYVSEEMRTKFLAELEKLNGTAKYSYDENCYVWFGRRASLVFYLKYQGSNKNVALFVPNPNYATSCACAIP